MYIKPFTSSFPFPDSDGVDTFSVCNALLRSVVVRRSEELLPETIYRDRLSLEIDLPMIIECS